MADQNAHPSVTGHRSATGRCLPTFLVGGRWRAAVRQSGSRPGVWPSQGLQCEDHHKGQKCGAPGDLSVKMADRTVLTKVRRTPSPGWRSGLLIPCSIVTGKVIVDVVRAPHLPSPDRVEVQESDWLADLVSSRLAGCGDPPAIRQVCRVQSRRRESRECSACRRT